jgi:general secretion pathway protein I
VRAFAPRGHGRAGGFTLIEVMVALAIVALGLSGLAVAMGQKADTAAGLRDRTLALYIGANEITTLRLSGQFPDAGRSEGETDYANREWRWVMRVQETGVDALRRVDVDVLAADRPDTVVRTVSGFVSRSRPVATAAGQPPGASPSGAGPSGSAPSYADLQVPVSEGEDR